MRTGFVLVVHHKTAPDFHVVSKAQEERRIFLQVDGRCCWVGVLKHEF